MSGALLSIAIVQVLTILVGLTRSKGLAILLGPADFGVASTIDQVVVTLVTFGGLALPFTAAKFLARAHSDGHQSFQRVGSGFLRLLAGLGVVTAILSAVVVQIAPTFFGSDLASSQRAMQVAVLGVPSALLLILFVNTFAAAQRPTLASAANLVAVAMLGAGAVAGAWWRGLEGLYLVSVTAAVVTTVIGLFYLARVLGVRLSTPRAGIAAELRAQPTILSNAATFYAAMCASAVTMLVLRNVVLALRGAEAAGHLQAAFSLALTVGAVLQPISNLVLVPQVNRVAPLAEKASTANDFAARMMVLLLLGSLPVLLAPELLMLLLFSSAFVPSAPVLWLFVLWQCVFQIMYIYQQLLVGLDDVYFIGAMSVAGFVLALTLGSPMVAALGIAGVAVALTAGMALTGTALLIRLHWRHRTVVSRQVAVRFVGLLCVVCTAGMLFSGPLKAQADGLLPRVLFALAVLMLTWLVLEPDERDPRRILATMRRRRDSIKDA